MLPNFMLYENFHFDHLTSFLLWVKLKIAFVNKYLLRLCVKNELCHRRIFDKFDPTVKLDIVYV